jgi:hypothetical protein
MEPPAGRVQELNLRTGETKWLFGEARVEKNVSQHPLEMLLIEVKTAPGTRQ